VRNQRVEGWQKANTPQKANTLHQKLRCVQRRSRRGVGPALAPGRQARWVLRDWREAAELASWRRRFHLSGRGDLRRPAEAASPRVTSRPQIDLPLDADTAPAAAMQPSVTAEGGRRILVAVDDSDVSAAAQPARSVPPADADAGLLPRTGSLHSPAAPPLKTLKPRRRASASSSGRSSTSSAPATRSRFSTSSPSQWSRSWAASARW
jgi:hypothetical protein